MSTRLSLPERIETYLAERRRLGFELQHMGQALARFARYVEAVGHHGPLTVEVMAAWARQVKGGRGDRGTAARALRLFRPFTRWLQQFEPATEVPDEATFGPVPGRVTPHIFRDEEIEALLGCDWLVYQDIEDLEAAVREGNPELQRFDSSCFDGQYVTGIEPGYFERIQQLRSDEAKKKRRVAS